MEQSLKKYLNNREKLNNQELQNTISLTIFSYDIFLNVLLKNKLLFYIVNKRNELCLDTYKLSKMGSSVECLTLYTATPPSYKPTCITHDSNTFYNATNMQ